MTARTLDLPAAAWTRLDNLARRLALPLEDVLAQFAGRIELVNHVAQALTVPIVPTAVPFRCTPGAGASEIAQITVSGNVISTRLRYRNEAFVDVVRHLRFRWSGDAWVRTVDKFCEPLADRVVELGVHLLAAGFVVEVPNMDLQRRILASDYQPEHINWVKARTAGKYAGWFDVSWDRNGPDYYQALSLIRGTRCYPGSALVRRDRYDEVLDFAGLHHFAVSDGALDLAARARAEHEAMLLVTPHIQRLPQPEPEPEPEIQGGILDELLDEPV